MRIQIDLNDPRALEDQITSGLRQALARGTVAPGDELPSVRQLAADLGVHWNTVARAYRRLADEGLLSVRRGRGATVNEPRAAGTSHTRTALKAKFADTVAAGVVAGLSLNDIAATFQEALAGFGGRSKK